MYYISAASTLSHQPTFKNAGFSDSIGPLDAGATLMAPDYKAYIDPGLLRRMSKILRMAVACARECLAAAEIAQPDAIVVGTGLGCLQDTEKFLNNVLTVEGLLPPTSFIQSTHNTIAGQISLSIGNHGYNMTHTQNVVSFEHALIDSMLLLKEDAENILVGSGDEYIELLSVVAKELGFNMPEQLASGSSFFLLSNNRKENALAVIVDCQVFTLQNNFSATLTGFLAIHSLNIEDIDMVLFASLENSVKTTIRKDLSEAGINPSKIVDYLALSGIYPTSSSFALHFAADKISVDKTIKNVLICNALLGNHVGLTFVRAIEA